MVGTMNGNIVTNMLPQCYRHWFHVKTDFRISVPVIKIIKECGRSNDELCNLRLCMIQNTFVAEPVGVSARGEGIYELNCWT